MSSTNLRSLLLLFLLFFVLQHQCYQQHLVVKAQSVINLNSLTTSVTSIYSVLPLSLSSTTLSYATNSTFTYLYLYSSSAINAKSFTNVSNDIQCNSYSVINYNEDIQIGGTFYMGNGYWCDFNGNPSQVTNAFVNAITVTGGTMRHHGVTTTNSLYSYSGTFAISDRRVLQVANSFTMTNGACNLDTGASMRIAIVVVGGVGVKDDIDVVVVGIENVPLSPSHRLANSQNLSNVHPIQYQLGSLQHQLSHAQYHL